ncbi:type II secretion system F family protein [Marinobacterium stanieri]|uniref:Type II secretory pathway, component PulF n=1 Tax=Marinobacterium stanieri TaxID=49186 RepID=A0A1N6XGY4_9GAMM|nr:type II secretion system F family protein [Marinobacterium stanieri]SIR01622.1 Type II secretory pathway, component PulF [Marinobacterium stanieri]
MTMSLHQLEDAAGFLGDQLRAGIPLSDVVTRMEWLQPRHAEAWREAAHSISQGHPLSFAMQDLWPAQMIKLIEAGEIAGTLPNVFEQIEETCQLQKQLREMASKLLYPLLIVCGGIGAFVYFMAVVIPTLAENLPSTSTNPVLEVAKWMQMALSEYHTVVITVTGGAIALVLMWFKSPQNRDAALGTACSLPLIGPALRQLYFGLFARYLSMMTGAGIGTGTALMHSLYALPQALHTGVELMEAGIESGMAAASDPKRTEPNDPRRDWPFYLPVAFAVAEETGEVDAQMRRASDSMIRGGMRSMKRVLTWANTAAMAISAALLMIPLLAYFYQMGQTLHEVQKQL